MGTQLAEALIKAGFNNDFRQSEKPRGLYHQSFTFPVTKFEIPIFIKVECERVEQGVKFISSRNLNDLPMEVTAEQAKEIVKQKLNSWFTEPITGSKNGMLRYWNFI